MKCPLDGIKVADFSWVAVGPTATRYLADFGATVVRIESDIHLDPLRTAPPFKDNLIHPDRSGYFANYNANKYGITLNLNNPKGREIAYRLVKWADVLVESFTPRIMKRWKLDYESVKEINPSIIYVSTTQFGQTGPYSKFRGYGFHAAAIAGFFGITGYPDGEPIGPFGPYADFIAPRYIVIAILAALLYRRKTGKGQYIDQSQAEASIHFIAPAILDYVANKRILSCPGNSEINAAPHNAYRCKGDNRWCVIAVYTDEEWISFCQAIGNPPWTKDPKFATFLGRKKNEDELDRLIENWTINFTPEEVVEILQTKGVPAGIVERAEDLHKDPQFKHRNHFWVLNHAVMGPHTYDAPGFRLSETPAQPRLPAPCLGQHNHYVCTEILGISDEEFIEFDKAGAFTGEKGL